MTKSQVFEATFRSDVSLYALCALCVCASMLTHNWVQARTQSTLQTGDLVFQNTQGQIGQMVAAATDSQVTHVGVVVYRNGQPWVVEARRRVRWLSLRQFEAAGTPKSMRIMRLKHEMSTTQKRALERQLVHYAGRKYDSRFRWGDKRLYCSELVWMAFKKGPGIEIARLQRKSQLYGKAKRTTRRRLKRYFGPKNLRLWETIISPAQIYQSSKLKEVDT